MKVQKLERSWQLVATLLSLAAVSACTGTVSDVGGGPAATNSAGGVSGLAGTSGSISNGGSSVGGVGAAGAIGVVGSAAGGGTSTTSGGSNASNGGVAAIPDVSGTPVPESAGTLVMRRLTYREYDHMVARLLGDTTMPASGPNGWSADAVADTGFISPNSVASYHVTVYNQSANALVDTALKAWAAGQKTGLFVIPCTNPTAAQETACATSFITTFGKQAYRRPVAPAEQADLLSLFSTVRSTDQLSFTDAIGAIAKAMLQSPNFLYHWEIGPTKPALGADGLAPLTSWQVASRLATSLWESMPDDTLLAAAEKNELATPAQITAQAQRMLADPQASQSLYSFHLQWLFNMGFHVTDLGAIAAKPNSLLTAAAAAGLQNEFTQFIASVYAPPGDGTLNTLYTAPYAFVNQDLAAIYGVMGPASGFSKVNLDPTERAGIFTQVAFLAGIEDSVADNPIYRGLAIYTKALCGVMAPPPPNVPSVVFKDMGTTRQAYDTHGSSACATSCHSVFDPPGFAFENYDGVGKYRTTDAGQPVDATGTFTGPVLAPGSGGTVFKFNNAIELSKQLAASPEAQACVDRQWARYMLGRMETTADQGSLQTAFKKGAETPGFSLRDMLVTLLSSKAFLYRQPSAGEPI